VKKLKLYKYRSINPHAPDKDISRILSILQGKLYFADWRDCNDPMEGYFQFYGDTKNAPDLDRIIKDKEPLKICSLSKTASNILMWSHYANSHQGVCIEIDCGDFSYSEENDRYLRNGEETQNSLFIKQIKYERDIYGIFEGNYHDKIATDILSRKIDIWKYEEEFRAFYKSTQGIEISVGKITKVIAGVRISADIMNQIKKNLPKNIDFVEAKIDFRKNKIVCI
jgi:hypothetical protein